MLSACRVVKEAVFETVDLLCWNSASVLVIDTLSSCWYCPHFNCIGSKHELVCKTCMDSFSLRVAINDYSNDVPDIQISAATQSE